MNKIRLIIADDHPVFRAGLRELLSDVFECIGEASDGTEAVKLAATLQPDVILMDVDMPALNGLEAAKQILDSNPNIAVMMLSAFDYDAYLYSSLRTGVRGFLMKTTPLNKLIEAIRLIHSGQIVLDASLGDKLVHFLHQDEAAREKKTGFFAARELEILRLVASGLTNKEIAQELNVSQRTVQAHVANILRKSETSSRTQAVYFALQKGWITMNEGMEISKDAGAGQNKMSS